jgi:hypothetical protein
MGACWTVLVPVARLCWDFGLGGSSSTMRRAPYFRSYGYDCMSNRQPKLQSIHSSPSKFFICDLTSATLYCVLWYVASLAHSVSERILITAAATSV